MIEEAVCELCGDDVPVDDLEDISGDQICGNCRAELNEEDPE